MKNKRMTQQQLADSLGITQGTVSRWYSTTHFPSGLAKKMLIEKHPHIYEQLVELRKKHGK